MARTLCGSTAGGYIWVVRGMVAYVGIRGPQPDYGHGGPRIVGVIRNGGKRTLTLADERNRHQESFEWGYEGAGPALLGAGAARTTTSVLRSIL